MGTTKANKNKNRPSTRPGRRRQKGIFVDPDNGAPSKLTPELAANFGQMLLTGGYLDDVCAYFGVAKETYRRWMRAGAAEELKWQKSNPETRGKDGGLHHSFRVGVQKGMAGWQLEAMTRIRQAAIGRTVTKRTYDAQGNVTSETQTTGVGAQWTADAWRLERRMPAKYGMRTEESVERQDEHRRALVRLVRAFGGSDAPAVKQAIAALASDDVDGEIDLGGLLQEVLDVVPAKVTVPA